MATTVKESFRQFASNLNISDRQEQAVSNCRANVVSKLSAKVKLHSDQPSLLIGSYDRDTLTRYLSERDVDIMVVLHYGDNKDWDNKEGTSKALTRFKTILAEAYPDTTCSVDRNCVTMKLSQFRLDVVPAFRYKEGYYTIPDTYREAWLKTDPVSFASEVTRINKNMNGSFVPLIKMIKGWNRELPKPLRGFHIECIMAAHYKGYSQDYTYDSMVDVFFSKLPSYLKGAATDPVTKDRVDLYLDNDSLGYKRSDLVARAQKAATATSNARKAAENDESKSIQQWKNLMGEFFPAYG